MEKNRIPPRLEAWPETINRHCYDLAAFIFHLYVSFIALRERRAANIAICMILICFYVRARQIIFWSGDEQ